MALCPRKGLHRVPVKILRLTSARERMYKSRIHRWGLDKKRKEHDMLDVIRQGFAGRSTAKERILPVRGKSFTLAEALHYFRGKGVRDPKRLLEHGVNGQTLTEPSAIRDAASQPEALFERRMSRFSNHTFCSDLQPVWVHDAAVEVPTPKHVYHVRRYDFATPLVQQVHEAFGYGPMECPAQVSNIAVDAHFDRDDSVDDQLNSCLVAIYSQTRTHYWHMFHRHGTTFDSAGSRESVPSQKTRHAAYSLMS